MNSPEGVVVAEYDGAPDVLARVRVAVGTGRSAGSYSFPVQDAGVEAAVQTEDKRMKAAPSVRREENMTLEL